MRLDDDELVRLIEGAESTRVEFKETLEGTRRTDFGKRFVRSPTIFPVPAEPALQASVCETTVLPSASR